MIGKRLGPYEITAKLGEGGMGEVWRAHDSKLRRDVAIKMLPGAFTADPDRLARFEREAQLLAQLQHPHIASIYGLEESGGVRALVMELVEGATLADRLANGALPVEEALAIARQIAEALEAAHEKGIVHRDLKPQNVKAALDGTVKVLDFGLAKAMDPASGPASADPSRSPTLMNSPTLTALPGTALGVILGTAAYMSPEQARGGMVDKRADIWAFGVVLFEMLTGRPLFAADSVADTLAGVLQRNIAFDELPAATPPELRRLLRRCLERNPKNRLRDIGDARFAIDEVLAAPLAPMAPLAPPAGEAAAAATVSPVRRLLPWIGGGLAGLALGAGVLAFLRPSPESNGGSGASPAITALIPPPPGAAFDLRSRGPGPSAISPDGAFVAFGAQSKDAATMLYVRALGDGKLTVYPGTEGAQFPFWSPDSRWIAFFSRVDGMLKKVPLAGGNPLSICHALNGKGGTWGADDTIVMAPISGTALFRVPAAGGEPVQLTELAPPYNSHRHPRFLPDGRRFLYLARSSRIEENAIFLGSLDGAPPRKLVLSHNQGEFASGRLLFVRESVLMAQPFDPVAGALSGAATPVADGVMELTGVAFGAFSASANGRLVLHSGRSQALVPLELRDRAGHRIGPVGVPGIYRSPAFSPDGRRISATGTTQPHDDNNDVWIFELRGPGVERFTTGPEEEAETIWSPDGRSLFFGSNPKGPHDLFRKGLSGAGNAELVYEAPGMQMPTDVSRDGKLLIFESVQSERGVTEVLDLASGKARQFRESRFDDSRAALSPDGRWLAWSSNETGRAEVLVAAFSGSGRTWPVSSGGGRFPTWRADGREIVYHALDGRFMAVSVHPEGDTFRVGEATELFRTAPPTRDYKDWGMSPDGKLFVIASPGILEAENELRLIVNWPALLETR